MKMEKIFSNHPSTALLHSENIKLTYFPQYLLMSMRKSEKRSGGQIIRSQDYIGLLTAFIKTY